MCPLMTSDYRYTDLEQQSDYSTSDCCYRLTEIVRLVWMFVLIAGTFVAAVLFGVPSARNGPFHNILMANLVINELLCVYFHEELHIKKVLIAAACGFVVAGLMLLISPTDTTLQYLDYDDNLE